MFTCISSRYAKEEIIDVEKQIRLFSGNGGKIDIVFRFTFFLNYNQINDVNEINIMNK